MTIESRQCRIEKMNKVSWKRNSEKKLQKDGKKEEKRNEGRSERRKPRNERKKSKDKKELKYMQQDGRKE